MNKEELQKNIALYYSKLSPKLQEAFSSMKWLEVLESIDKKYNLTNTQKELLSTETTLLLLAVIPINEYIDKLTKELTLPAEITNNIITEINDSIMQSFLPELIDTFKYNAQTLDIETEVRLDERFNNLPEKIKSILEKSNYQETLYMIGKNYGLNVNDMGLLEKTVVNLMVGHIKAEDFELLLEDTLKIPTDRTKSLANEINEKILKEIRQKMKSVSSAREIDKNDDEILKSAGIEIIPARDAFRPAAAGGNGDGKQTLPVPEKLELQATGEIHPIVSGKLSGPVQTEPVKTVHSADNLTKTPEEKKYAVDPYRELPE